MPVMREWAEIQKLHDILSQILEGKLDIGAPMSVMRSMSLVHDTLCWVLNHENKPFDEAMLNLEAKIFGMGFEWVPEPDHEN